MHRKLGLIFAAGNLPDAHESFTEQHQCKFNKYCEYYKIPKEYGDWHSYLDEEVHSEDKADEDGHDQNSHSSYEQ